MSKMTKGSVLTIKNGKLTINEAKEKLGLNDGDRLLLITSTSKIIRLFPLTEKKVWFMRVNLDIDKFHSIVKNIHSKVRELDLRIVHTSGVCIVREDCFLEVYFELDNQEQIMSYSDWLGNQDAVISVETEQLDVID